MTVNSNDQLIERLLAVLDLESKVHLLAGRDYWSLPAVPAIGLDALVMSDGPVGVRGTGWAPDQSSVVLSAPTALAATWDPALAERAGRVLGQAARRRGVHVLLAPTVNLHRTPYGGRHFECYSEDPLLTAEIGAAFVAGVQAAGVAATVKHFVANDSETERLRPRADPSDRMNACDYSSAASTEESHTHYRPCGGGDVTAVYRPAGGVRGRK
jgi:beta-glucosidase